MYLVLFFYIFINCCHTTFGTQQPSLILRYVQTVAGQLHDIWRSNRLLPSGTYEPRIKVRWLSILAPWLLAETAVCCRIFAGTSMTSQIYTMMNCPSDTSKKTCRLRRSVFGLVRTPRIKHRITICSSALYLVTLTNLVVVAFGY